MWEYYKSMKAKTARNKKIKQLRKRHLSYVAIGKIFNINRKTVWGICNDYPIKK